MAWPKNSVRRRWWQRLPRIVRMLFRAIFQQDKLLFKPRRPIRNTPAVLGLDYDVVRLPINRHDECASWWVPGTPGAKTVLLFQGRQGNIGFELDTVRFLRSSLGLQVFVVGYPGYGDSDGHPSEAGLYAIAQAAYDFVRQDQGVPARDIVLYGRSMGAGVATWLASRNDCAGLVFHNGFSSIANVASVHFPALAVRLLCRISLDSEARIGDCRCPLIQIYSRDDEVILLGTARSVFERANGRKRFIEVSGGHYDTNWIYNAEIKRAWHDLLGNKTNAWAAGIDTEAM